MNKDERIVFLEETARRLLRERSEWEIKARRLEGLLQSKNLEMKDAGIKHEIENELIDQTGELIRPKLHDIKGALGIFRYALESLFRVITENSEIEKTVVNSIYEKGRNSLSFVCGLLDELSWIGGQKPYSKANIDLNKIISSEIEVILSRYKDVKIELQLDNNIGTIVCYEDLINQIIRNLTINAIEACLPEFGNVLITTRYVHEIVEFVHITIRDNGYGIMSNEGEKIFNLHFTTKGSGYGIGLYIVKRAVELHKGTIEYTSSMNHGTEFRVKLPINRDKETRNV